MNSNLKDLADRYAQFSNHQLLEILEHKDEYTPEAILVLQKEISKRNLGDGEVEEYQTKKKVEKIIAEENAMIPLKLWEKIFFYMAWFAPGFIANAIGMNYKEDGLLRKIRQSRFFRIAGFIGLLGTAFIGITFDLGDLNSFLLLLPVFGIVYWIDTKVNFIKAS